MRKTYTGEFKTKVVLEIFIDRIYTDAPYMGLRPITAILNRRDFKISRPIVQKYMREIEISAIRPRPNLSRLNHQHKIYLTPVEVYYGNCTLKDFK